MPLKHIPQEKGVALFGSFPSPNTPQIGFSHFCDPGHGLHGNPFFINQIQEWYGSGTYWSYRPWKFQGIYGKNIHPFFAIKTLGKCTGFGLYAVKSLSTKYQGKISVDTEVEKGRTFKLEFPALSQT